MTKRDFELIARVLSCQHMHAAGFIMPAERTARIKTLIQTAKHFADELGAANPRFDRDRFMAACGFKGE